MENDLHLLSIVQAAFTFHILTDCIFSIVLYTRVLRENLDDT